MRRTITRVVAVGSIACFVAATIPLALHAGEGLRPVQVLAPSDAGLGFGEGFGGSVAISDDWLVVGAPYDHEREYEGGAVYVFRRMGARWLEHEKLFGLISDFEDGFGWAVAIDGDWIVVGAPVLGLCAGGCGIRRGTVFRRNDRGTPADLSDDFWDYGAALHPPPSHLCCRFGVSVAIDGEAILVGSARGEFDPGRAYAFKWNGSEWTGPQTLTPMEPELGDEFGVSVSVSGGLGVIGAVRAAGVSDETGAAYVFRHTGSGWSQEAKLTASDGERLDFFGTAAAIGTCDLVVGARNNRHFGGTRGAAYVFVLDSGAWSERTKLFPSTPTGSTDVAWRIGLDGDHLLLGATQGTKGYLFEIRAGVWVETGQLPGPADCVDAAVAIDGPFAVIGNYVYAVGDRFSLADFAAFENCFTPVTEPIRPECERFDLERDERVDARDLSLLLLSFRGP